jgi:hypothetical protein
MGFVRFMATTAGRASRAVAGIALIAVGYAMHSFGGTVVAIVGLLPLLTAAFDLCAIAPLMGGPLRGEDIRNPPPRGT